MPLIETAKFFIDFRDAIEGESRFFFISLRTKGNNLNALKSLYDLLEVLPPITLDEMKSIRLMKRTDTKFVTNRATLEQMLVCCRGLYFAQRVEGEVLSEYATTYFDDAARHRMFAIHQAGHRPRTKVRVRTYVGSDTTFLEVKRKDNHGKTTKRRVCVPSLKAVLEERAGEDFLRETAGMTWDDLIPTVGNRFRRITLVNTEKTERLTIDLDLKFHNYETGTDENMGDAVIIELKRDGRVPSPILPILRRLRIKPQGFSKYCIGSVVTNGNLRVNNFKFKLRMVRKTVEKPPVPQFQHQQDEVPHSSANPAL